jgi:hypothetical protein
LLYDCCFNEKYAKICNIKNIVDNENLFDDYHYDLIADFEFALIPNSVLVKHICPVIRLEHNIYITDEIMKKMPYRMHLNENVICNDTAIVPFHIAADPKWLKTFKKQQIEMHEYSKKMPKNTIPMMYNYSLKKEMIFEVQLSELIKWLEHSTRFAAPEEFDYLYTLYLIFDVVNGLYGKYIINELEKIRNNLAKFSNIVADANSVYAKL